MASPLEMKKAAIKSTDNEALNNALIRLGWTQSDLARHSKTRTNIIGDIINLKKTPTKQEANAIQRALGKAGEYLDVLELWPASFATPKCSQAKQPCPEIHFESLLDHPDAMETAAPENENEGLEEAVEAVLSKLPKRTYFILKLRFWRSETHERIGDMFGVSRVRVQLIEGDAFRTLKHPAWVRKLGAYMPRHLKLEPSLHPRRQRHLFSYDANRRSKKRAMKGSWGDER